MDVRRDDVPVISIVRDLLLAGMFAASGAESPLLWAIVAGFGLGVPAIRVALNVRRRTAFEQGWRMWADALGLRHDDEGIRGTLCGVPVAMRWSQPEITVRVGPPSDTPITELLTEPNGLTPTQTAFARQLFGDLLNGEQLTPRGSTVTTQGPPPPDRLLLGLRWAAATGAPPDGVDPWWSAHAEDARVPRPLREAALAEVARKADRDPGSLATWRRAFTGDLSEAALRGVRHENGARVADLVRDAARAATLTNRPPSAAVADALSKVATTDDEALVLRVLAARAPPSELLAALLDIGGETTRRTLPSLMGPWEEDDRRAARMVLQVLAARLGVAEAGRLTLAADGGGLTIPRELGALTVAADRGDLTTPQDGGR